MGNSRNNPTNICHQITNGVLKVTENFILRPGEPTKLLIPIGLCVATAGFYAFPSVAFALFTHSLLPTYTFRALGVGSMLGIGNIVYGRVSNKKMEGPEEIQKNKDEYIALVIMNEKIGEHFGYHYRTILTKAFQDNKTKGVIIVINSLGGSPTQASIIQDHILKLKEKHHKKVVVVGEDYLISGAYYIATSADSIYVNANTITGSINVTSNGYDLSGFAKKYGIESRTYTAGAHRSRDPLLPEDKEEAQQIKEVLNDIHNNFIEMVLNSRKDKLKAEPNTLFSGYYWTGKKALELGLVDAIGNLSDVMQKEFDVSHYKEFKLETTFYELLSNFSHFVNRQNVEVTLALNSTQPQVKM